jgi:hypothetical protein
MEELCTYGSTDASGKGTYGSTDASGKGKKKDLFIFDLDDTLFLHNLDEYNRKKYEDRLIPFLYNLKKSGKILTLVTYNTDPQKFLNEKSIGHLFDYIYMPSVMSFEEYQNSNKFYENSTVWITGRAVKICRCKGVIAQQILEKYSCSPEVCIFFDDHKPNVDKVKQLGIESVLVDPLVGIQLN